VPPLAVPIPNNPFPTWFQGLIAAPSHTWAKFVYYGLAKGTRDSYKTSQEQYKLYVAEYFPGTPPWPATETLICSFAAYRLEGLGPDSRLKGASLEKYITGLRSYHIDRMWPTDIFTSETLKRIVRGSYELYGRSKKLRLPITRDILAAITTATPQTIEDLNLQTCFLLSFAAFLRMGEVTYEAKDSPRSSWFFETKVTRSCIKFSQNNDHVRLHLKRSKTDIKNEGTTILVAAIDSPLCPVKALLQLFNLDPQQPNAPLFSFSGQPFTKDRVHRKLNDLLQSNGIDPRDYTLHSFRKGAAQHAKDSGMRDDQIQALGRWTSQAFQVYFKTSAATLYAYQMQFQNGKPLPFGMLPNLQT
jgi:hypothetical protein